MHQVRPRFRPGLESLETRLAPAAGIGTAWPVQTNPPTGGIGEALPIQTRPAAGIGDAWAIQTRPAAGIGDAWTVRINPDAPPQPAPRDVPIQIDDEIVPDVVPVVAPPAAAPPKVERPTTDLGGTDFLPTSPPAAPILIVFNNPVIPLPVRPGMVPATPFTGPARPRTDLFSYGGAGQVAHESWKAQSSPAGVRQTSGEAVEPMAEPEIESRKGDLRAATDMVFLEIGDDFQTWEGPKDVVEPEAAVVETVAASSPAAWTQLRASRIEAMPMLVVLMGCWTLIALRARVRVFVMTELCRVKTTGRRLQRAALQATTWIERAPPRLMRL